MSRFTAVVLALLLGASLGVPATAADGRGAAAAPADPATATILVGLAPGADAARLHRIAGFEVRSRIDPLRVDVVAVPSGAVRGALATYRALPGVEFAERNRVTRLAKMPSDDFVRDQYSLRQIRAHPGWMHYGHRWRRTGGVRIAIVDSGIDLLHPEFEGKVSHCRSWLTGLGIGVPSCQDSQVHGTHVAGIAAATTNNGTGIAGVGFDAQIMALQAFNSRGSGFTADIAAAIVYAAQNGARVANYSFSAATPSQTERRAVAYARRRGVTQVGATGNTGKVGVQYPARYPQVIAVTATNRRDRLASFATRGRTTEVAAPGEGILSALPGNLVYGEMDGTSMAAPHVAGLAALLRGKGHGFTATRKRIRRGADDRGPVGKDTLYGFGRIHVARSLRLRL